jgi:hypothetical protein
MAAADIFISYGREDQARARLFAVDSEALRAVARSTRGRGTDRSYSRRRSMRGGRIVYWSLPDGHVWEALTVSYARAPGLPSAGSMP